MVFDKNKLLSIVAKLPKTKDGIPVVPNVDYVFWESKDRKFGFSTRSYDTSGKLLQPAITNFHEIKNISECFSTYEKAIEG